MPNFLPKASPACFNCFRDFLGEVKSVEVNFFSPNLEAF